MKQDPILTADLISGNVTPQASIVEITPDIARGWLERNVGNRPLRPAGVKKYERAMRSGNWKMTGEPIKFSRTGKLIDGQHRLQAVVNSGTPITAMVIQGLNDDVFDSLDAGMLRSNADILFIELGLPVETCRTLASAANLVIDYEKGQYVFKCRNDRSEIVRFVDENPELIEAAEHVEALGRNIPARRALAALFYFYASRRDQPAAERFLNRFMVGAVDGVDDNLLFLRNRCFSARVARRKLPDAQILRAMIRFWNAEQRGKPIKYPQNALRVDDKFPTFI